MPKLPTFSAGGGDAPAFGGRRAEAGDFDRTGAGLVQAGRQIQGAATELMSEFEQQEARKALVGSTEIRAKYNRRLDEAAISGEDTEKIKQEMLDELSKVGSDFQTKRGTDSLQVYTANNEITFDQEASRIKVVRAAVEAHTQADKLILSWGKDLQRAREQGLPSALPVANEEAGRFVDTLRTDPATKREIASKLRKAINQSDAMSYARADPDAALKAASAGEWELDPEQRESVKRAAEHYGNVRRQSEDREKARVKEEELDKAKAQWYSYSQRILKGDNSKSLEKDIVSDPAFAKHPQMMEHLATLLDADRRKRAGEERKGSKKVEVDLWLRYQNGEIFDQKHIVQAVKDNSKGKPGLDLNQANRLINDLSRLRDENFQAVAPRAARLVREFGDAANRNMTVQMLAMKDPELIPTMQAEYRNAIEGKMLELRKQDLDPRQVFDPDSKHYVGPGPVTQEIFDRVTKKSKADAVDAAKAAGVIDLRNNPGAVAKLKVGDIVIPPDGGRPGKVTKELLAALKANPPVTFPITPSGETPEAVRRREAEERSRRYHRWLNGN